MFNDKPELDRREQKKILEKMPLASGRNARAIMGARDYVELVDRVPYDFRKNGKADDPNAIKGHIIQQDYLIDVNVQGIRDQLADVTEAFLNNGVVLYIPWNEVRSVRFNRFEGEYPYEKVGAGFFPYVPMMADMDVRKIETVEDPARDRFNQSRYGSKTPGVPTDWVPVESGAWPLQGRYGGWGEIFNATTNAVKDLIKKRGTQGLEIVGMRVQPLGVGLSTYEQLDLGMVVGNVAVDIAYDGRGFGGRGMDILVPQKEDRLSELERRIKVKAKNR
ncbi:hypothetical protein HZC30_03490 [Candidatus Woesearchaeota archaeon]|nr:hypothetical protein [Candidatus Woesearchaeota archaeon]